MMSLFCPSISFFMFCHIHTVSFMEFPDYDCQTILLCIQSKAQKCRLLAFALPRVWEQGRCGHDWDIFSNEHLGCKKVYSDLFKYQSQLKTHCLLCDVVCAQLTIFLNGILSSGRIDVWDQQLWDLTFETCWFSRRCIWALRERSCTRSHCRCAATGG